MSPEFAPEGKGHRVLRLLQQGSSRSAAVAKMLRGPNQTRRGADLRAMNILIALRSEGLVRSTEGMHHITPEGTAALAGLNHGIRYKLNTPAVRYFTKETA